MWSVDVAGLLVHEYMHWTLGGGHVYIRYDDRRVTSAADFVGHGDLIDSSQKIAIREPDTAVDNPDNYQMYVWNVVGAIP